MKFSSKHWVYLTYYRLLSKAKIINLFVRFSGESMARQSAFDFIWPLGRPDPCCINWFQSISSVQTKQQRSNSGTRPQESGLRPEIRARFSRELSSMKYRGVGTKIYPASTCNYWGGFKGIWTRYSGVPVGLLRSTTYTH